MLQTTSDGWITTHQDLIDFVIRHDPPRPYSYITQLGVDLRSWRIYAMLGPIWALGIICSIGDVTSGIPLLLLATMLHGTMLREAVTAVRYGGLERGRIQAKGESHVLANRLGWLFFRTWRATEAMLANGELVPVTYDLKEIHHLLEQGESLDVLIWIGPKPLKAPNASHSVVAYRPTNKVSLPPIR